MKVRITPFIEFAYGDKRKDKSTVSRIVEDMKKDYDPATDRYKQFREKLTAFEEGNVSEQFFLEFHKSVAANKKKGFETLAQNYIDLKEDYALIWDGIQRVSASLGGLEVQTSWYLHTDSSNQKRIIFLNFRKESFPTKQEKGLLTLLPLAAPEAAGVGILNIQSGTLILATRPDVQELVFLETRAKRFKLIADAL